MSMTREWLRAQRRSLKQKAGSLAAGALSAAFVLGITPAAQAEEATNITTTGSGAASPSIVTNGHVTDIHPAYVTGEGGNAVNKFDHFTLANGDIANMYFNSNFAHGKHPVCLDKSA